MTIEVTSFDENNTRKLELVTEGLQLPPATS